MSMSIRSIGEIYWKQPQYSDEKLDVSDENSDIYRIFEVARNNINGLNLPDLLTLSMYLEGKLPLPKKKDRYASDIKPDYTPSHKKLHKFGESRLLLKCRARINELEKCDDVKLEGDYIRGTRARRDLDIEGGELKPGGSARDIVLNRGKPRTPAALRHVGAQQLINTNSITLPYKGHPNRKVELQKLADVFSANLRHAVTSNNVGMVKTLQAKMRGKLMIDDDFPEMTRLVVSKNAVECEFSIKLLINTLEQEMQALHDADFVVRTRELQKRAQEGEHLGLILGRAAVVRL